MDAVRGSIENGERRGRWQIGPVLFDDRARTLIVGKQRVTPQPKVLDLLRLLMSHDGATVSKDVLIDALWPGLVMGEQALQRAVMKLRRALGDDGTGAPIIETVPRIGYRLAVPVTPHDGDDLCLAGATAELPPHSMSAPSRSTTWGLIGLIAVAAIGGISFMPHRSSTPAATPPIAHAEAMAALRALDLPRVTSLLDRGWDPNAPLDKVGSSALDIVVDVCEWNPQHDRQQMMQVVRALLDAQAKLDQRNIFGDTPYSIAKAPRYCGPDHPVTKMIRTLCYSGATPLGDRCLAKR